MNSKKPLTKDQILYASERAPGYALIVSFVEAVKAGTAPEPETLKKIAGALERLYKDSDTEMGLWKFAKELGLQGKQGRKPTTASDEDARIIAVLEYMTLRQDAGCSEQEAAGQIAEKYGKSCETIRRWAQKHGSDAKALERMVLAAEAKKRE